MSNRSGAELLILRHAKSSWKDTSLTDFERPLNKRGKRDAPWPAHWMLQHDLVPDCVFSSPAKRAKDTTLAVVRKLDLDPHRVTWVRKIYEAPVSTLMDILEKCPSECRQLLLVGHNPGLEQLIVHLATPETLPTPAQDFLKTATLAHLHLADGWAALRSGANALRAIVRPEDIHP